MLFWQPDYDFDKSMAEIRNIALNLIDIKFWCSIWSNIKVIDKETNPGESDNPLMMPQQKCLRWKEKELCSRVLLLLSILNPRLLWRTIRRDERRLTSLGCPPLPCTALLVSMGENPLLWSALHTHNSATNTNTNTNTILSWGKVLICLKRTWGYGEVLCYHFNWYISAIPMLDLLELVLHLLLQ